MEPTIGVDDGYVLVPAGDVAPGDIVTFWSPSKDAYVTHRVVDRSANGFITKGDNNPSTDQRAGYSAVTRDQILGEVLTVGGAPVIVPNLGTAIRLLRAHLPHLLVGVFGTLLLYGATIGDRSRRELTRLQDIFQPLFVIGLVSIAGLLALAQPGHETTLVAVASVGSSDTPNAIAVGASKPIEFVVHQPARPLVTRVVETHGMTNVTQIRNATAVSVSGTVPPPESTGPVRVGVDINQYPAVVPRWALVRLQAVHPLLASGVSAVVVLAPLWVLYHALVDPHTPLRSRPSRLLRVLWRGWD